MIDMRFFWGAIALMLIIIIREILRKRFDFDMDKVDVNKSSYKWYRFLKFNIKQKSAKKITNSPYEIIKNTGDNSLVLLDAGENKATVMATLRQITSIDYESAKHIVNNVPCIFMSKISEDEANLTKKALEFVGAKIEIK